MARDGHRPWSVWLRRYRAQRDLTQEELGAVLNVDGKAVSAWENGQRPGRRHARTICDRLGTTRVELGLVEADPGPVVGRRDFMRLSAGIGSLAFFGPWAGAEWSAAPAVEGFEVTTEALERLWLRVGPAAVLGPALGHVEAVTRLLQGSLPGALRPRVCGVLAESLGLLAVCKDWIGDGDGAGHLAVLAAAAARESGDADLGVRVRLGLAAGDRRLAADPEARLQRWLDVAGATQATQAWAAAGAAEAHAALGRVDACLAALDEAADLLAEAPARRFPWPDQVWLSGERGVALARLGWTAEARRALDIALARTGQERLLDRMRWLLARALADAGDGRVLLAARQAADLLRAARSLGHGLLEDEVGRLRAALPGI